MARPSPEEIDEVLPQTQCGLCGYGGCMPYAEAIAYENAPINLCPPGGVETLKSLAQLVQADANPFIVEMQGKAKKPMVASIREMECIGCTKCIQACPVDAIVGSAKVMHTIIADECTGCELCLPPCPVDCIDLMPSTNHEDKKKQYRQRFNNRQTRIKKSLVNKKKLPQDTFNAKKNYIVEAIARAKAKKKHQA